MSDDDEWLPDADADAEGGDEDMNRSPVQANYSDERRSGRESAAAAADDDAAAANSHRKTRKRSCHDNTDEDYGDDERQQLRSFYEEAAITKNAGMIRRSTSLGAISTQSATTNLSLGELSRLEENHLSQSSHHEEEEERQRKKLAKRARKKSGVRTQQVWNFTEEQVERMRVWQRFKNAKAIDVSQEQDVGGSMEYLVRKRLSEQAEQKRLKLIADAREEKRKIKLEEEAAAFSGYDGMRKAGGQKSVEKDDNDEVYDDGMWNFLDKGFVNMPLANAEKLPYYVYKKTECESDGGGDCADHLLPVKSRNNTGKQGLKQHPSNRNSTREQFHIIPLSFPLQFNQLTSCMDLHSMVSSSTFGSERMVFSHGKNAVRLWARMVANGLMVDDFHSSLGMKGNGSGKGRNESDEDSVSNVSSSSSSSSSESSVHSYHPEVVHSQMTYGTTSVVAMKDGDDNDATNNTLASKQTPLFRLMAMVHKLPKSTHRNTILLRIALDIGINRGLWENELSRFVDCSDSIGECNNESNQISTLFTPLERWAIKSFFGVDGSISSPPSWASDPSMPTHEHPFKVKIGKSRKLMITRLRRWIDMKKTMLNEADSAGKESYHISSRQEIGAEHIASSTNLMSDSFFDKGDAEQSVHESSTQVHGFDASNTIPKKESDDDEGSEAGIGETFDHCSTAAAVDTPQQSYFLDLQKPTDPGDEDIYAKIIQETNIDSSHVEIALASLVAHLSSSMARLRQLQELNSSHNEHRNTLNLAINDVNHWHEHIVSYLRLAETLCAVREANFYRSGKVFPQSAPLAKTVMMAQSYFACGGGACIGRKSEKRDMHDEDYNISSDSEASVDDIKATMQSQHSSTNSLRKQDLRSIKLAARELARSGKDRLLHRHLVAFTPIHFTTGIAIIADNLTPSAAELVSRGYSAPFNSRGASAFDLMKNMLTLIEDEGSLISAPKMGWNMRGKIIDSTLVKTLQEAASIFRMCTEKDPENVEHWSWYVATLLGMLCIAFGNASDHNNIKVESEVPERQPLQCFIDIRNNTAVAVRQFLTYAQSHDAPMFHFAISSMLEWNKATLLLHRPQDIGFGLEVRRLYAYHVSCCISFVELFLRSTPLIHNKSYYSRSDISLGSCNLLEHFHY